MSNTTSPTPSDPLAEWTREIDRQEKMSGKNMAFEMSASDLARLLDDARRHVTTLDGASLSNIIAKHQQQTEGGGAAIPKELLLIFAEIAHRLKNVYEELWGKENDFMLFHDEELPDAKELCEISNGKRDDSTHSLDLYLRSAMPLADKAGAIIEGRAPDPEALKGKFSLRGPAGQAVNLLCQRISDKLKEMFTTSSAVAVQPVTAQAGSIARVSRKTEQAERLRKLRFEEIVAVPGVDESVWLKEPGDLYAANELPDEVFWYLLNGEYDTVLKIMEERKGGMFNRWEPKPEEMAFHGPGYRSPKEQIRREMLGLSGTPGRFRMFCLRDEKEKIASWMTCRVSPTDPEKIPAYQAWLEKTFFDPVEGMDHIEDGWERRIRKWFPRVMEFHTINVSRECTGAGTLLLRQAMAQIEKDMPPELVPTMIFCYRYDGVQIIGAPDSDYPDFGGNDRSSRYTHKAGFVQVAYRMDRAHPLIRSVPHMKEPIKAILKERYLTGLFPNIGTCLDSQLVSMGFPVEELPGKEGASTPTPVDDPAESGEVPQE